MKAGLGGAGRLRWGGQRVEPSSQGSRRKQGTLAWPEEEEGCPARVPPRGVGLCDGHPYYSKPFANTAGSAAQAPLIPSQLWLMSGAND